MEIVVVFATESEFAPWRRIRRFHRTPGDFREAQVGEARVRVVVTGIGPVSASGIASRLRGLRPDFCIATGLAGGLKEQHASGRILVARAVMDRSGRRLACEPGLVESASRQGACCVDSFISNDTLVGSTEAKRELGREADAVDMESYCIVREMGRLEIPVVAIRAIADPLSRELPQGLDRLVDADGLVRWWKVAGWLARSPLQVPALVSFGRESLHAASALAVFLDGWIRESAPRLEALKAEEAGA